MKNKTNILIVLIICVSALLVALIVGVVTFILYTNSYQNKKVESTAAPVTTAIASAPVQTAAPILYVTNVNNSISLRQFPDENGAILTTIPLGAAVEMINIENNGFTHIKYNNIEGYSKTMYLTSDANGVYQQPSIPDVQTPSSSLTRVIDTMYVTNVENAIYLRTGASENADIITTIPLDAAVGFITDIGNGFYKISYNGQMGYSKAKYLTYRSPVSYDTRYMRVTGVKHSIYLRKTPSENSVNICEIPVGTRVIFIERYNDYYYRIRYNGMVGYATSAYLTFE